MSEDTTQTVETPTAFTQSKLDIEAEALIRTISEDFKTESLLDGEAKGEIVESAPPISPTEQSNTVPPPPETPKPEVKPEDGLNERSERGFERLISRELDVRKREEAVEARLREVEAREKGRYMDPNKLELSPTEALRASGIDPEQLVRRIIAERMGDRAPDELKFSIREAERDAKYSKEMEELRARLDAKDADLAAREFVYRVTEGARQYVTQGLSAKETSEQFPTLSRVAKQNPDRVHQEIMKEISQDAAARAAREPHGEPLPYPEAAKRVEARWKDLGSLLSPSQAPDTASTSIPKTQADGKNPTSLQQPSTPTGAPRPPERPLAPWLQKVDLEEEGIRQAMAEFRKHEGR